MNAVALAIKPRKVLGQLKYASGEFEMEAVQEAIRLHNEVRQPLLNILEAAPDSRRAMRPDYTAHLYAIHILGEVQETLAYLPLLRLCLCPSPRIDRLFGDFINDGFLYRALAGTSGGDISGISILIGTPYVDESVQSAALDAVVPLAAQGRVPRSTVIDCLRKLFHSMQRTPSQVWGDLVGSAQDLQATELRREMMDACNDELVDYKWRDIKHDLDGDWEMARSILALFNEELDFERDSWWTSWNRS